MTGGASVGVRMPFWAVPQTDIESIQSSERLAEVILGAPAENAPNETVMANRDQLRERFVPSHAVRSGIRELLEGERRHARTSVPKPYLTPAVAAVPASRAAIKISNLRAVNKRSESKSHPLRHFANFCHESELMRSVASVISSAVEEE